jgi:hypothetical protein
MNAKRRSTITPISKKCRLCNQKRLLVDFELDNDTKDKHSNICKECMTSGFCNHCVEQRLLKTAETLTEVMIMLVQDGMVIPPRLANKINGLAILAGVKTYCDGCNERLK